ncbi:ANTAR domain-containing protein [Aquabacterium sp.]|uniref:ANTAR domain-containing protein n=1 Tax=Aquabacterium sp. TaxID=1872578 RepID=UPI002C7C0502|nr:ANTAR domain-containing protein [Aquabacterium sp.]HSW03238.1 ANTAR domain-containing protein [Aquabacterium sp.]
MPLLIAAPEEALAEALAQRLRDDGWRVAGAVACRNLVREAVRLAPELVVVQADVIDVTLVDGLMLMQAGFAAPVMLFCESMAIELTEAALAAGVLHCAPAPCTAAQLALASPLVRAQFKVRQTQQRELAGALARLEERKWVDRAKGMLMSAQQLSEPDAFALLRTASMQANLRVGEVSRALIEAAEAADAVNRAGQLRMLSQRIVKALALTQAGVDRALADTLLRDSASRAQANIDQLAALALHDSLQPLRAATLVSWQALRAQLPDAAASIDLAGIDAAAQQLLDDAQRLTDGLQAASGRRNLQVVNLSGRQRMLCQRLAKQALLAGLLPEAAAQAQALSAGASVAEFDAALLQLEQAPLTSDEIRATLAVARGQWQRMLGGMRDAKQRDSRLVLARESEALLQSFERLTSLYEHSVQLLLS